MEQLTFSQYVAAKGGKLPWQEAVRLTLLTIQVLLAQPDAQDVYVDVSPSQIILDAAAQNVLSCGKVHVLKEWDASDCVNKQLLPWEFCNPWSTRTEAAQVYPVAACLYWSVSGVLPRPASERIDGDALEPLADLPEDLNHTIQKGLALNAADRWASLNAFQTALASVAKAHLDPDGETETAAPANSASHVAPLDLSHVRTVEASKSPKAVYTPTAQKKSFKLGAFAPVLIIAAAFVVGLLSYQLANRPSLPTGDIFLPTASASSVSSSSAAESSSASEEAASSETVSSDASSEPSASSAAASTSEAPASASSIKQETPASSAASSSKAASSKAAASASPSKPASSSSKPASEPASSAPASSAASSAASNTTQTLTLADGSKFVGTVDGSKSTGTLTTTNGNVYTGTFTDGKLEGKGTLKTSNGSTYSGNFVSGQLNGSATVKYANGDSFSGSYTAGVRDGDGTYTWASGTTYRGTWKSGKVQKGGTYDYTDEGIKGMFSRDGLNMQD